MLVNCGYLCNYLSHAFILSFTALIQLQYILPNLKLRLRHVILVARKLAEAATLAYLCIDTAGRKYCGVTSLDRITRECCIIRRTDC